MPLTDICCDVCRCSSSGRAPPCQGGGSEFEPRHLLQKTVMPQPAGWPIGRHSQVVRQSSAKAPPPVRVWVSPPNGKAKKDIEGKIPVFSSLSRLVDWKIYESLFPIFKRAALTQIGVELALDRNRFYRAKILETESWLFCCQKQE